MRNVGLDLGEWKLRALVPYMFTRVVEGVHRGTDLLG